MCTICLPPMSSPRSIFTLDGPLKGIIDIDIDVCVYVRALAAIIRYHESQNNNIDNHETNERAMIITQNQNKEHTLNNNYNHINNLQDREVDRRGVRICRRRDDYFCAISYNCSAWTSPPTLKEFLQGVVNGHSFMAGRVKVPKGVATSATCICLSVPGCTVRILQSCQWRGYVDSWMRTRSPIRNCLPLLNHFERAWRLERYSFFQRVQKWRWRSVTNRHLCSFNNGTGSKFGSGSDVDGSRVRKWLGVSASKSVGSLLNGQRGREFSVASIWVSKVVSSSPVNRCMPIYLKINDLIDLTPASHNPPKCGDDDGLKYRRICLAPK